jgi:hypothetical protein
MRRGTVLVERRTGGKQTSMIRHNGRHEGDTIGDRRQIMGLTIVCT